MMRGGMNMETENIEQLCEVQGCGGIKIRIQIQAAEISLF